jgi:hypothetical protein
MSEETVNPDAEKVKKLLELKQKLEERMEATKNQLKELQLLLELLDTALMEKSFKKAEIPEKAEKEEITPPPTMEYETSIPLKTVTGELLANLYLGEGVMHIIIPPKRNFNINTPPFKVFLIERVLAKMQEKDREAVRTGKLPPEKIISYNIIRDGDTIRELVIQNVSPERVRELKSSIRWTLEKMYEKLNPP